MTSILSLYAVTPCHAGSGSSLAVVDLPIQRERHTNWPVIHASGMKGAMRACFDMAKGRIQSGETRSDSLTELVFGSEKSEYAGSLSVSDAKILAFPMRSSFAPFVWITSTSVLARLNRDLKFAGKPTDDLSALRDIKKEEALWVNGSFKADTRILIEEVEVTTSRRIELPNSGAFLGKAERLLVVHDEIFGYGVSHCTSVAAHIAIDQQTGTTRDASLRYQEELPSDTLMYSVVLWGDARDLKSELVAQTIKGFVTEEAIVGHLQVGGDETLGRGIFEIEWI
ncbi:MAG: type III-B CRISPR module RAMP protein Cmr4 [Geobacteraceae bacterium]|nr:type III-B CRISPR module RAMP protein Cmr4 [Geobacteraceae bacterium]